MNSLTSYRVPVLIMTLGLLLPDQPAATAQSVLDSRALTEIPEAPPGIHKPTDRLNTEIVIPSPIADSTIDSSPYLVRSTTLRPQLTQSPILAEIYFDWNRERLKAEAGQIVEHTAGLLRKDSTRRLKVRALCDERGTEAYSLTLSRERLSKVTEYLRHLGIPATQITHVSYGTHAPCITRGTDCFQENQGYRDTFRLLSMASSRAGCLVQLSLEDPHLTRTRTAPPVRKPFLQRIHLAEIR